MKNQVKRIKFITHYPAEAKGAKYNSSPAAKDQINYICNLLSDLNYDVEIITLSQRLSFHFYKPRNSQLANGIRISELFSFFSKVKLGFFISKYINDLVLFFRIFREEVQNTKYIIYHMDTSYPLTMFALKFRRIDAVLQVCELYSDAGALGYWRNRKAELKFINSFDKFILSTQLLTIILNDKSLKCVIEGPIAKSEVQGVNLKHSLESTEDGDFQNIRLVYAGNLSHVKKGAYLAIDALKNLPERYRLTILGVGSNREFEDLKSYAAEIYDFENRLEIRPAMRGRELTNFLSTCDIGLATQDASALLNTSSFPAKVYLYLNNGLRVVAPATEGLKNSMVAQLMSFYDGNSGESIAMAIMNSSGINSVRVYMDNLHHENLTDLKNMLEGGL